MNDRLGELVIDGWAGRIRQPVRIVGETPTRYRVTPIDEVLRLPFRRQGVRQIWRGGTALVPKTAVRLTP